MNKKIILISAGRSDYDRYYPILKGLNKKKKLKNPYQSKLSVSKVVDILVKLKINDKLLKKNLLNINNYFK